MAFALPPNSKSTNAIETSGFLVQGSKKTIKIMVSATLVEGQRKQHNKTNGFCIAPQQQVLKRYTKPLFFWCKAPNTQ